MKADETLDCIGLYCPMPIVKVSKKMKEMASGQVLMVLADDKGIKSDMPAWAAQTGNELLEIEEDGPEITLFLKKK